MNYRKCGFKILRKRGVGSRLGEQECRIGEDLDN